VIQSTQSGSNAGASDKSVFKIQLRSGIWGVKLDGRFFGDYRTVSLAMESVEEKVRTLRTAGRSILILTLSAGGDVLESRVVTPA
jgi:hypothetical protein